MSRLASAVTAVLLVGCASEGDEAMVVLSNTAVINECKFSGTAEQAFIVHGQIFSKAPVGYVMTPLIQSRVKSLAGDTDTAQRTIYLTGANVSLEVKAVTIEDAAGNIRTGSVSLTPELAQFSSLFGASLAPGATANITVETIPVRTLRAIHTGVGVGATDNFIAEVLATITVLGTLNDDEVSSKPFHFPISVCSNCVVVDNGACPMMVPMARSGNACNVYQDGMVDCCRDASNNLVCPGTSG